MSFRRLPRCPRGAAVLRGCSTGVAAVRRCSTGAAVRRAAPRLALLPAVCLFLAGCLLAVEGAPSAGPRTAVPGTPEELERLVVGEVPSGLPRLPDHALHPPAGAKTVEDVAGYASNPHREREVLDDYGYRFGWERFWGHDPVPITGVFVDQFEARMGAAAYAADLARNDAEVYRGVLREDPSQLPGGCRLLIVEEPEPEDDLTGPAAFGRCAHGVFSVSATAVADSVDAASDEVHAVLRAQLDLLPPG